MVNSEQIKYFIDSNMIYYLVKFNDKSLDPHNYIHQCLKTSSAKDFQNNIKQYTRSEVPLLYIKPFSDTDIGDDGTVYYQFLKNIALLDKLVKFKKVELFITPLVALECSHLLGENYVKRYIKAIKIKDEDYPEFKQERDTLADLYLKHGAMKSVVNGKDMTIQPSNDAYIQAEASILGLDLITHNINDFFHMNKAEEDFARQRKISTINGSRGHIFTNQLGEKFISTPQLLKTVASRLSKRKAISAVDYNFDSNGYYIPKN